MTANAASPTLAQAPAKPEPPFPSDPADRAIALLGGASILGIANPNGSPLHLIGAVRKGFPARALDLFASRIQADDREMASMLGVSESTLARRRQSGSLLPAESERLFRIASSLALAEEAFEDLGKGMNWMRSPLIILGGLTPLSLLDTELGNPIVLRILANIVYGLPA